MVADTKKVQTLINISGNAVIAARASADTIDVVRAKFTAANPDVIGTPIEGQVAATNTALNAFQTAVRSTDLDVLVNSIVPTHRNDAL